MSLHLCLFTDSTDPSGVGEHMLTLAAELQRHYRITFVCPPTLSGRRLLARASDLGLEVLALEAQFHQREALETLRAWVERRRVDIFHVHAGVGWEGFGGADAARAAGVPLVVRTEHLPYLLTHPVQRADYRRTAQVVDRIICVSEEVYNSHLRAEVPAHKLRVVRNGIRPPRRHINRTDARARLDLPARAPIVLTVGRFSEQKGHRYLLEAIPAVIAGAPDVCFVWVGQGPLEPELRQELAARGLLPHICFLGHHNDIPALMAAADLFVLPSLFEGLPLVVLEAMAAGLPVVGTRVCGTSEVVADGLTGRLVPSRDGAALAAGILEVLDRPEQAARWGAAGRRRVAESFSAARMAAETATVYQELAGGPAAAPARLGGLHIAPSRET